MSPMVCIECGRTYQSGEKFCARDDTPLVELVLCDACGATRRPGERTCTRCAEIELEKLAKQRKATLLKGLGAVAAVTLLAGGLAGYLMTRPHRSEATRVSNAVARSDDSARQVDVVTGLPAAETDESAAAKTPEPQASPEEAPAPAAPAGPAGEDPSDRIVIPERGERAGTGSEGRPEPSPSAAPEPSPSAVPEPAPEARPVFPLYVGERPGPSAEELSHRERFDAPPPETPRARRAAVRKASLRKRVAAAETKRASVRTASAGWVRDEGLETELAGRGVSGVKVLRKGRSLRLTGSVSDDMQLRALYDYVNQRGFGEVEYGVEVR